MSTILFGIGLFILSLLTGVHQNLLAVTAAILWLAFIVEGKN